MAFSDQSKANVTYAACFLILEAALIAGVLTTNKHNQFFGALVFMAMVLPVGACVIALRCATSMFDTPAIDRSETVPITGGYRNA